MILYVYIGYIYDVYMPYITTHQSEFCLQIVCSCLRNIGWAKLRTSCFYFLEILIPASYFTWPKYSLASPFRKLLGSHMLMWGFDRILFDCLHKFLFSLSEKTLRSSNLYTRNYLRCPARTRVVLPALDVNRIQKKSRPFTFSRRITSAV